MSYKRASFDPANNETITGLWDFSNDVAVDGPYTLHTDGGRRIRAEQMSGPGTISLTDNVDYISVDTSTDPVTLELPLGTTGKIIEVKDASGNASVNNITLSGIPNGDNIDDVPTYDIVGDWDSITLIYYLKWNII